MSRLDPPPADAEAEVQAAVRALLHDWADSSPQATERFLASVSDDFTGHGTGPGDYYADKGDLRAMVVRERAGTPFPFTLEIPHIEVRLLTPEAAVAEGRLRVKIDADGETLVEAPRFSFALARRGGQWRLVHFHFSVPDAIQHEGDTMQDIIETRTQDLERIVEERTAELRAAQAQLVQQEKMASLGALTAGIAHEIKNPLNFVTNFAGLLVEMVDDLDTEADLEERAALLGDIRTNASKIEAHGRRADAIVRSMMAHARTNSGERRPVDLNALVSEHADLAWHGLKARRPEEAVSVTFDLDPDVGVVKAVPQEVGRVLINLLDNAFDAVRQRAASEEGGYAPSVTVRTRRLGDHVEVRVADNGVGIPEAARLRIFEPFFTTKPSGQGTGLGLSLSHDVVVQGHGGTLEIEDSSPQGTTFLMTLPSG